MVASKKQTPFSVWYATPAQPTEVKRTCLKEADAFQRLVSTLRRVGAVVHLRPPQRSRRLSASGMRNAEEANRDDHNASKKQTPFSVWYCERVRRQAS